jgi:hypothetical protein
MPFRRQASWAKIMAPAGKLTALAFYATKKVNKTEDLAYLSTNIWYKHISWLQDFNKPISKRRIQTEIHFWGQCYKAFLQQ